MEVWIIRQDFTDLISEPSKSKGLNDSSSQVHIVMCYIYIFYIKVSIFVFWNRLTAQDFGSIYFGTWGLTQVPVSGVLPCCSFEGFPNLELRSYNWYNQVSYLTPSVYLYWQKHVYTTLQFRVYTVNLAQYLEICIVIFIVIQLFRNSGYGTGIPVFL